MCIATPGEIAGLINAGFAHLLRIIPATKVSVDMKTRSVERSRVWMVQIAADGNGCAMHRNGTCLLSGAGLTPKTGSFHLQGDGVAVKKRYPEVIEAWEDTDNIPAIGFALLTIMNQDNAEGKHTN
jgi:hypothetical protein